MVFESRNGDRVNVAEVIWLGWPDVIAEATTQAERTKCCCEQYFHGAGEADASGEADAPGGGDVSDVVVAAGLGEGSGAVVVSGTREAGGGSDKSVSGDGNGASSFDEPRIADPLRAVRPSCVPVFFFDASAAATAG